jgi:acyl-coenzyme A synthetase/AMP-(fatty) acid ligase
MTEQAEIPARLNLAGHCLGAHAATTPDKTALIVIADANSAVAEAAHWTYAELDVAVRRVAAGLLGEGLRPGGHLLIRLPSNSDYALLFFGAISAGIVPIPASPQLTDGEVAFLISDSEASAIAQAEPFDGAKLVQSPLKVFDRAAIERIIRADPIATHADTGAEAPAYMIYTSGTTARPKGVVHAHRTGLGRRPMHVDWQGLESADVMLHAGAFNWSFTLGVGMIDPWSCGATAVLYSGPRDIMVWPKLISVAGATLFAAVPSLYRQILKYCDVNSTQLQSLRYCLAAGEALSPAVLAEWRTRTEKEIYESFGMSECSTFVSNRSGTPIRPGSTGKAQRGRRVAVLPLDGAAEPLPAGEVGLLAIHKKEPGLMLGYWNRPDEDGRAFRGDWFVTGDLAVFDDDGYMWHHGRADDIMNAGGYRVSPAEVEAALANCPGIAEVAVAEHHVRHDVSVITAFVVPANDSDVGAEAILAYAARSLAPHKRPKEVVFLDKLPRSPNGKLLRRLLGVRGRGRQPYGDVSVRGSMTAVDSASNAAD